jgi:hypothetical protein
MELNAAEQFAARIIGVGCAPVPVALTTALAVKVRPSSTGDRAVRLPFHGFDVT